MADARPPMTCPACAGDGGWDVVEAAPGTLDGTRSHYVPCTACDETGEVEDCSEPLTEDDAVERDAELIDADQDAEQAAALRGTA